MGRSAGVALALVVLATGCAASDPAASTAPSSVVPAASDVASGPCPAVTLVSPEGSIVDLDGTWEGSGTLVSEDETALLNQIGGCLYGSVNGVDLDGARGVANLSGPIQSDFTIPVEVAMVLQEGHFRFGEYSTMVLLIEWDDGRIRLREDRPPGVTAGRCVQSALDCPAPVIWYRLEDGSPPT